MLHPKESGLRTRSATISDELKKRRHEELAECFAVIDSCLACYYRGEKHMYRPLAGQLRILLCDKQPLLTRVFPTLKIGSVHKIEWSVLDETEVFEGSSIRVKFQHPEGQEFRVATMPFLITKYSNGLQAADLILEPEGRLLSLGAWMDQRVTIYSSEVTLREVVKAVANKGGGAHIDDLESPALRQMTNAGPAGVGVHVLLSIALGRFAQHIGLRYLQLRESFGLNGRLQDVTFDPAHPTVEASAKIPPELSRGERHQYRLTGLKRVR